ncbi:L,D-transpeptidase family protein [Oceanidesulfovibrio indonesiensis]|uniref:L,D-transpeptidase family protein n=1 Tax=Oceanidesulfovibrio indonesiensis TaxID=54767 RepID=UPI001430524C|nr:L,D-transpeptidase family protein [Oceanidesulfovibrio indonesiensis]
MRVFAVLLTLMIVQSVPGVVAASEAGRTEKGWTARIVGHTAGPSLLIGVSKKNQQLYLFQQKSPLSLKETFVCTTGELEGDKYIEGDLKTPEGVYFTERRLDSGLDPDLYGKLAYTLNFPNPVDRLKGKTGSGIWIHGRGHALVPRETKGCVALYDPDMAQLEPHLDVGLPVVIAEDLDWRAGDSTAPPPENLEVLVKQWALAWQAKSEHFFEFYDSEKFSKAHRTPFKAFRDHKENLFNRLPWIQVAANDVVVVPGPDYWVTAFSQYYRSPHLTSAGVKRLYWQKDEDGALRIVGREFREGDAELARSLEQEYLRQVTAEMDGFVEGWRASWERGNLDAYVGYYASNAEQGGRRGVGAIRDHKISLWKTQAPELVKIEDMRVDMHPQGVQVQFTQKYAAAGNYSDLGSKTLVVTPSEQGWRILREDWRAL